jgi:hypothetical protein
MTAPHLMVTLCVMEPEVVRIVHNGCGDDVRDLLPLQLPCLSVCLTGYIGYATCNSIRARDFNRLILFNLAGDTVRELNHIDKRVR